MLSKMVCYTVSAQTSSEVPTDLAGPKLHQHVTAAFSAQIFHREAVEEPADCGKGHTVVA